MTTNAHKKPSWDELLQLSSQEQYPTGLTNILNPAECRPEDSPMLCGGLKDRILADSLTWAYYREVDEVRVCDALALHHYLDPDLLRMRGPEPYAHFDRIAAQLRPGAEMLLAFRRDMERVSGDIGRKYLHCKQNLSDPLQSFTTIADFAEYVMRYGLAAHEPSEFLAVRRAVPFGDLTPLIAVLAEASRNNVWMTKGKREGGSFELSTSKRVVALLTEQWGVSKRIAGVMATMLRPAWAARGRPKKAT